MAVAGARWLLPFMPALLVDGRRDVAERRMTTFGVVVADEFKNRLARLLARSEMLAVHAFDLQCAVERFHRRVVPAVAFTAHRHRDATRLQNLPIVLGSVLRSAIRVMHQTPIGISPA